MKKSLAIILFIITCLKVNAGDRNLYFSARFSNENLTQQIFINENYKPGENIEGYFFISLMEQILEGKLVKGGFNFMSPEVFHLYSPEAQDQILKRHEPCGNVDSLSYGIRAERGISFYITPDYSSIKNDSVTILFKYYVFTIKAQNNNGLNDVDYNLNAHYEHIRIPTNKNIEFDFLKKYFPEHNLEFMFGDKESGLIKAPGIICEEIQKASQNSLTDQKGLSISAEYLVERSPDNSFRMKIMEPEFEKRIKCDVLQVAKAVFNSDNNKRISLQENIYGFSFSSPFRLYNTDKEKEYEKYETREQIFNSELDLNIIPLKLKKDTLEVTVFISAKKIKLDNVMRWTPLKISLSLPVNEPVKVHLPKENWSANFERKGEKYNIYGFTDYEKFVDEYIIINFNSPKQKGDN